MQLTDEQDTILSQETGSMKVSAGAGSGKTTTMAHFVNLQIQKYNVKPQSISFITFTRFAAQEIKNKVKKVIGRNVPILTGTFHSTMSKLLHMANIMIPDATYLYDGRMEENVKFFMTCLEAEDKRLLSVLQTFKILVVDEFQDLDLTQFKFVQYFKKYQPTLRIIAIGDLAQNIYRFRGTSNEFLRTLLEKEIIPDLKSFNLTTNFRSSKAILRFINFLFAPEIKDKYILPMRAPENAMEGTKPKYFEYAINPGKGFGEYEELVANTLLPIIKRARKELKSFVLIFPIIKCTSFQLVTSLLRHFSKKEGFAFDLHQIAKEDETSKTVEIRYDPRAAGAPVQFSTFHAAKGLEWDIVAIVDASDSIFKLHDGEDDSEGHYAEKTNLVYVGMTRPIEELYIFANANMGGRNRLLARYGDSINEVLDITKWGEEEREIDKPTKKPIGVRDLLRKLSQHPDLLKRIIACSEKIKNDGNMGIRMKMEDVYDEMKMRNKEMAFGTYIDWKLKSLVCKGDVKSFQDILIELVTSLKEIHWSLNRHDASDIFETLMAKLDVIFMNSSNKSKVELKRYICAYRYIGLVTGRRYMMVDSFKQLYWSVEKDIFRALAKEKKTVEDEYIISQTQDFYTRGSVTEIQAIGSPTNSYQGLPENFKDFIVANQAGICTVIKDCLGSVSASMDNCLGDIALETESLIMGEADIYTAESDGVILEVKCGPAIQAIDLREAGSCKNLLQILAYVAMGRHGTILLPSRWALLVNPQNGAWERYDLSSWSHEDSALFMQCLEELRMRG